MLSFEDLKMQMLKEVEEDLSSNSANPDSISEEDVVILTASILDVVKGFGKTSLAIIKNSDNPFDEFLIICQRLEMLAPKSKTLKNLKDTLDAFKRKHKYIGIIVGIISTIVSTVVKLVLSGIKLLFKIVGAVLVTLANMGYRIVKDVKDVVTASKNSGQCATFTQTFEE